MIKRLKTTIRNDQQLGDLHTNRTQIPISLSNIKILILQVILKLNSICLFLLMLIFSVFSFKVLKPTKAQTDFWGRSRYDLIL